MKEENILTRVKTWLKDHLPQAFVGAVEYHLEPQRLDSWGGAFNGQCFRQLIFLDLVNACHFDAIVETGTFRGSTTLFLCHNSGGSQVYSTELNPRFFEIARRRLQSISNLHLFNLDSETLLQELRLPTGSKVFFYLDAHWREDLPLAAEIKIIFEKFETFVIMIDDFQVPGDAEYAFDDYGPGKRLSLCDFPFHQDERIVTYVPDRAAIQESGLRRGCVVLASLNLKAILDSLNCLRVCTVSND